MRRRLLTLVVLGAALLVGAALCAAPALADSGRSDTLVLRNLGHGKAALVVFASSASSLTPTTVWSGALPTGARLAAGSFDGAAADEALVLAPRGRLGARLYLFSPGVTGYACTTVWNTTKAGFSVASSKVVAADINGDGRDELVVLVPSSARGARLLGFTVNGAKLSRTTPWSSGHAPFAIASAQLAAGDLTGSGKTDLLVFSQAKSSAGLWGFRQSGTKLALHGHWSGHLPANTKLACGVTSNASRFSAWLVSPTSSSKARLTTLRATSRGFAAHRAWSGSLRLSDAQLSGVDLAGAGPVDLVVLAPKGKTGATLRTLTPKGSGYSAQVAWSVASGYQAARLTCAPSLAGVLAPHAVSLPSSATSNLVATSSDLSTLTFSGGAPSGATVGSVLVGAPTTLAPQGILCQVTGVSSDAGRTTLSTTPASLDQAFSSLDLSYSHQLSVTDFAHLKLAKGVRLAAVHPARYGPLGTTLAPPSVTVAIDHDIDGLHLDGSLTLSERVDLDADITWLGGLKSASVTSTSTEDGSLTATASAGWSKQKEVTQYLGSWPIVIPTPLGFPIELTATLNLVVGAKASFEVGVTTGVTEHADFTIGASYANGRFTPIAKPGFSAHCVPRTPTIYGTADVKAYMGPQLLTTLYDVAGPSVGVDGYGEFEADTTADPWWTLHGGLEGSIGFEMQILSHVVASWNYSHNFYDHIFAQAPGGSTPTPTPSPTPTATPTPTPSPSPTPTPPGPSTLIKSIDFPDAAHGWAVCDDGNIVATSNGGSTWSVQDSPTSSTLWSVDFVDASNGWSVGDDGIVLHTTSGGISWTAQSVSPGAQFLSVSAVSATQAWIVGADTVFHTSDGGASWSPEPLPAGMSPQAVDFVNAQQGWVCSWDANGGSIAYTQDGGSTWTRQDASAAGGLLGISLVDAQNGWAVGNYGALLHTSNGGASWTPQTSNWGLQLISICALDANTAWAVGGGVILHTVDGGSTWTRQYTGTGDHFDAVTATSQSSSWVAGMNMSIYHTNDGGQSWSAQ